MSISGTTPRVIIQRAIEEGLDLALAAPLEAQALGNLEARLGVPLPAEIREVLSFTRGFIVRDSRNVGFGDFALSLHGLAESIWLSHGPSLDLFPVQVVLAQDGCGNPWFVEVDKLSGEWGRVWYGCHDPPVLALQATLLARFLEQVFDLFGGRPSDVRLVTAGTLQIYSRDPWSKPALELRETTDPILAAFVATLGDEDRVVDLRAGVVGSGLPWAAPVVRIADGRSASFTKRVLYGLADLLVGPRHIEVRRYGSEQVFALVNPGRCRSG